MLNDQNFDQEVKQFDGIVLVDFYADWCGPCKIQGPIIDDLARDYETDDSVKILKLNVDESPSIAQAYGVMSIPTLIIFKNGEVKDQLAGVHQKDDLKEKIDSLT